MAIDNAKRAFIFGDLIERGDDYSPVWLKFAYGSAYRAYCGPTYSVLCCGINFPYYVDSLKPKPLQQLNSVNVTSIGCAADFVVCACSDRKLLIIPLRDLDNFTVQSTVVEEMNDFHITHISVCNEDVYVLIDIDSIENHEKFQALPKYVPFHQPLDFVLAHIKNMPSDTEPPHFLRTDLTFDSLQM